MLHISVIKFVVDLCSLLETKNFEMFSLYDFWKSFSDVLSAALARGIEFSQFTEMITVLNSLAGWWSGETSKEAKPRGIILRVSVGSFRMLSDR